MPCCGAERVLSDEGAAWMALMRAVVGHRGAAAPSALDLRAVKGTLRILAAYRRRIEREAPDVWRSLRVWYWQDVRTRMDPADVRHWDAALRLSSFTLGDPGSHAGFGAAM